MVSYFFLSIKDSQTTIRNVKNNIYYTLFTISMDIDKQVEKKYGDVREDNELFVGQFQGVYIYFITSCNFFL